MIGLPAGMRVYLACGVTDMRKGFDGLTAQVQTVLELDPHNGAVFVFRGKRGDCACRGGVPKLNHVLRDVIRMMMGLS